MQYFLYLIIYAFFWVISVFPFFILYIISDVIYILLYYILRYRRKVVRTNLSNSFPLYSIQEIKNLEKKFYHYFTDYFFETIKGLSISQKELDKRMIFNNKEILDEIFESGNSCILYLAHYGNWEWVSHINNHFKRERKGIRLRPIYSPLRSKAFDKLFLKIRTDYGSELIPKKQTLRRIIQLQKEKKQSVFVFVADQNPTAKSIHKWIPFLNQNTPILSGAERIARQTGYAVVYFDIKKVKRGYYTADVVKITDNPKDTPDYQISEEYMHLVEQSILRDPSIWLWSHKRWKHTQKY